MQATSTPTTVGWPASSRRLRRARGRRRSRGCGWWPTALPPGLGQPDPAAVLPFNVWSTTTPHGSTERRLGTTITVQLDRLPGDEQPDADADPPVAGVVVARLADELEFVASGPLVPGATETVTVPGGPAAWSARAGPAPGDDRHVPFTVAAGSILRLQQLLAELGYLPLTFTPTRADRPRSPRKPTSSRAPSAGAGPTSRPRSPRCGPHGQMNVITKGAIMDFEDQHGLKTDGLPGPQVWTDLLADAASGHADANPYRYVVRVSKTLPRR